MLSPGRASSFTDVAVVRHRGALAAPFLTSPSVGETFRVHFLRDVYFGSHIDSTFVTLVDRDQTALIRLLEKQGLDFTPV